MIRSSKPKTGIVWDGEMTVDIPGGGLAHLKLTNVPSGSIGPLMARVRGALVAGDQDHAREPMPMIEVVDTTGDHD